MRRGREGGGVNCDPQSLIALAQCADECVSAGLMGASQIASACAWANAGGGPPCTLPTAPVDLGASAGNGQVTLTWPAGTGATGYNIKRSLVPGGPYTVIGASAASPYVDLTALNGITYYYVVSSTNACGESAGNSLESHATPGYLTDRWYFSNTIPAPGTSFAIGFEGAGSRIVDWGDGTIETTSGILVDTHVYAAAGNYIFSVRESIGATTRIYFGTLASSGMLTGILTPPNGMPDLTNLYAFCYLCSGLTGTIPDLSSLTNLTTLEYAFSNCTGLTGGFPDLTTLTALTSLADAFFVCTGLTGDLPILSTLTNLTTLYQTFLGCNGLSGTNTRTVAQIFGVSAYPNLTTAEQCFYVFPAFPYLLGNAADFISLVKNAGFVVGIVPGDGSYQMFLNQTTLTDYATMPAAWK